MRTSFSECGWNIAKSRMDTTKERAEEEAEEKSNSHIELEYRKLGK